MEVDLQRRFVLIIGFYVKPYFPVKEVCLDWQKWILQIQIQNERKRHPTKNHNPPQVKWSVPNHSLKIPIVI